MIMYNYQAVLPRLFLYISFLTACMHNVLQILVCVFTDLFSGRVLPEYGYYCSALTSMYNCQANLPCFAEFVVVHQNFDCMDALISVASLTYQFTCDCLRQFAFYRIALRDV